MIAEFPCIVRQPRDRTVTPDRRTSGSQGEALARGRRRSRAVAAIRSSPRENRVHERAPSESHTFASPSESLACASPSDSHRKSRPPDGTVGVPCMRDLEDEGGSTAILLVPGQPVDDPAAMDGLVRRGGKRPRLLDEGSSETGVATYVFSSCCCPTYIDI